MIPALSFSAVTKKFAAATIVAELSFSVNRGEFFALVGGNGAGKTTLIKCLLDFCSLDGGSIEICGASHRQPRARENLVFLPERFTPPHYLTGANFLDLMRRLHGGEHDTAAIHSLLHGLDFDAAALKKPVRALSKGMTQKLGLAGVLLTKKPVFVLDEPMSGLDPKARALLKARLRDRRRVGATVFFTSHQLADVDELADRLAILHHGELRFCGSPQELRDRYHSIDLETAYLKAIG